MALNIVEILFVIFSVLLVYAYLGYPLLIGLLARLFARPHTKDEDYRPVITLIISAYNEGTVLRDKLRNTLALDYPQDKFRVIVVSDGSTDETDSIVREFADQGVLLLRPAKRQGKTAGLNLALEQVASDLVVFSDANAIYDSNVLRKLARHFADPQVGYAVGHARYQIDEQTAAGASEGSYWNFEVRLKQWESDFASVVGGDGAIYAIRTSLWEPLQKTDINDFVNPLQIVAKGYRGIFDVEAWCSEKPAGEFTKEFGRKVRIVNRSFNGLLRVPQVLNPFRVGRFTLLVVSHKLLRWFSPVLLLIHLALVLCIGRSNSLGLLALLITALYGLGGLLILLGAWWDRAGRAPIKVLYYPYYFFLMNVACSRGLWLRLCGEVITTWDTVRQGSGGSRGELLPCRTPLLLILVLCLGKVAWLGGWLQGLAVPAIYALLALLVYTYVGYPAVLGLLALFFKVTVDRDDDYCPAVTLLIAAYNEGAVIEDKLNNCLQLDYPADRLRILVASDGSQDDTETIVRRFAEHGIELLAFDTNRGKISALNDALEQIDSELVVFSDANVMYDKQALRKLARNFHDPRVGAVSGKVVLLNEGVSYGSSEKSYYGIEHFIQEKEGQTGAMMGADGAMYAIRRHLFRPPQADTILDDLVISMEVVRQGYWLLHEKEALGYEQNVQEVKGEFKRKTRIVAGGIQCLVRGAGVPPLGSSLLLFKYLSHKVLRWLVGPMTCLLMVLLALESFAGATADPLMVWAFYVLAAGMVTAVLGQLVPVSNRILPVNMAHYLFMLKLASLIGCSKGLLGQQKVTWRQ